MELQKEHQWSDAEDEDVYKRCDEQVKRAVEAYHAIPEQPPGEFFDYMFARPTADLEQQKQEWLAEVKRHG